MDPSTPTESSPAGVGHTNWIGSDFLPPASRVRALLILAAGTICLLGYLREWARLSYGIEGTSFFNLNREQNIGAWFSATLLAACAFILYVAARKARASGQKFGWFWYVLSATFVALSIDEASSVHEMVMLAMQSKWETSGIFTYSWVILALALVPIFALLSLPFLFYIPRSTATWFIASGTIYVTGALGFEMLEGLTDGLGPTFVLLYLAEETLEIVGLVAFFSSIMGYLNQPMIGKNAS
jgi:hypothetical protein